MQPSTTKPAKFDLEGEEMADLRKMANFVDLYAIMAETDTIEASEPQGDDKGRPRLEKRMKFELVKGCGRNRAL